MEPCAGLTGPVWSCAIPDDTTQVSREKRKSDYLLREIVLPLYHAGTREGSENRHAGLSATATVDGAPPQAPGGMGSSRPSLPDNGIGRSANCGPASKALIFDCVTLAEPRR